MKNNDYIIKKSLNNNIDDNFTSEEIHKKKTEENEMIHSENSYYFKFQICNIIIHINKKELFLRMHVYLVSTSLKKKFIVNNIISRLIIINIIKR